MDSLPRLHALSTGSMTSSLRGFLEGEEGDITFQVPVYLIEAAGFDAAQADQLIITHLHFDHSGGMGQIPKWRLLLSATHA